MRPRNLEEFIGQDHILGEGRLLRRAIQADQLSSLIFYGPPGTGKTTLARVIAGSTKAKFIAINAVLGGVKDIREAVAEASSARRMGQRTILFVDEVHRFNKAQQDALLPWVENGTVILIGATTENPYFEVNKALVSRSRIFQLKPLDEENLRGIIRQALETKVRGYGDLKVNLHEDALEHLVNVANGDARAALNAIELAVTTTEPDGDGVRQITREVAEESIQRRAVLYDKEGDVHFDTISAFIKSMRGSDPDAALYWLSRMVYAGEDPRFIFRRMIIFASEDIGLADPNALQHTIAASQAYDYVGMPEGRFHLSQAVLYLATAPKSNSTFAFFDALRSVEEEQESEVPNHLRDASRDSEGFGHGQGYLYPHAYRDHWVAQQYLPGQLQGKVFYQPGELGHERDIREQVARRREAQLAAMLEQDTLAPPEVLTMGPPDRARDRWLQRTVSEAGARLAELRDDMMKRARLQRHEVVLDLAAGSGLLTWEALRHVPEGRVYARVHSATDEAALKERAQALPELDQPVVFRGDVPDKGVRFDAVLGRSATPEELPWLFSIMREKGRLVLALPLAAEAQRLYALVKDAPDWWREAEEELYARLQLPDAAAWQRAAEEAGFSSVRAQTRVQSTRQQLSAAALDRWFPAEADPESYAGRLNLSSEQLSEAERLLRTAALAGPVSWQQTLLLLSAVRYDSDQSE